MRKDLGKKTWMLPCPVLVVATYDHQGNPNAMTAAWGGIYDTNQVMLCLSDDHKTTANIRVRKAFTISFADAQHVTEADYIGLESANDTPDKLKQCGIRTEKSKHVDAPILTDFPIAIECKLNKFNEDGIIVADIVNVSVAKSVLDDNGNVDIAKANLITYNAAQYDYRLLGPTVGHAFSDGKKYM